MSQWIRKRPLWPFLGALCALFALAIAAPLNWHRQGSHSPPRVESVAASDFRQSAEILQPESRADQSERTSLEPELASKPALLPGPDLLQEELPQENSEPSPPIELAELAPTIPPIDVLALVRRKFDFDALLRIRDALRALVDQRPTSEPEPSGYSPRVQVANENDRLAMLDSRDRLNRERMDHLEASALGIETNQEPIPSRSASPWLRHRPEMLMKQLESFLSKSSAANASASGWADSVLVQLRRLTESRARPETDALAILDELEMLVSAGNEQTKAIADLVAQHEWLQAIQALERRLPVWRVLLDPTLKKSAAPSFSAHQPNLMPVLGELLSLLTNGPNGSDWREYLMLDRIAAATSEGAGIDAKGRGELARKVLSRMSDPRLTAAQKDFLATAPLKNLRQELQPWAARAVDFDRLAALIERYETGRELRYATAIAKVEQQLRWSDDARLESLGNHLDKHYRAANMRIALTDDLLNRLMPPRKTVVTPVRDRIAGSKVRGQARTTTHLQVRLLPDPRVWQFSLEASGEVYSNTRSDTWPAWVKNKAKMQYHAKKTITIDRQGLHASPAKAKAHGRHELVGVDSQFDAVPLLGYLLRDIARNQNRKSRPKAMAQVKSKVVRQARRQMDSEADPKLENLEKKFRTHVLTAIEQLSLVADPVAMYTTPGRAVMQLRLANGGQLAAHTLRPFAPSDSVASVQLHETVLNNALAGLRLDGRRLRLTELFYFFAAKLGQPEAIPPADLPPRAVIEFASRDAILLSCDGDRLELVLNIRELAHGRDKIRNFQVHAFFRPVMDGLDVRLVREGTLQFAGRRLKTGPRIVLHSVFGKLLRKDQEVRILAGKLQDDPRLEGLMVTQLVIDGGWIGLALGPAYPERNAWRTSWSEASSAKPAVR